MKSIHLDSRDSRYESEFNNMGVLGISTAQSCTFTFIYLCFNSLYLLCNLRFYRIVDER